VVRVRRSLLGLVVVLTAGCDALLGVTDVPPADAGVDATVDAAVPRRDSATDGHQASGRRDAAEDARHDTKHETSADAEHATHDAARDGGHADAGHDARHDTGHVDHDAAHHDAEHHDARHDVQVPGDAARDAAPDVRTDAGGRDAQMRPSPDAGMDAAQDTSPPPPPDAGADTGPPVPLRQVAPLSTSRVSIQNPTLRWVGAADTLTICRDRACARGVLTMASVDGEASYAFAAPEPGVYFWYLTGAITTPTWQFTVPTPPPAPGTSRPDTSWGTTLDLNGDGYADVAVGAPGEQAVSTGYVYYYLGSGAGLTTTPNRLTGSGSDGFGYSVASAGDVNGDGYADLVVGAPYYNTTGGVYVYFGGPSGPTFHGVLNDAQPGVDGQFGYAVSSAGDVDGDGYADVIVSAPGDVNSTGYVYLYKGGPSGLTLAPGSLSALAVGFGSSIASAGDVNGDGFGDILVGAPAGNGGVQPYRIGTANVFLGGAQGFATSPITLTNGMAGNGFGRSVACAGDVEGDGYADVIVGSSGGNATIGQVYVYLGGAPFMQGYSFNQYGSAASDEYGWSVASAGDVNADGYSDIAVGVPYANGGNGVAYVYYGPAFTAAATLTPTSGMGDTFGWSVASAGDVSGDGVSSVLVGAIAGDTSTGTVSLFVGGSGGLGADAGATLTDPGGAPIDDFGYSLFGATN
jgi:hypothetical protein